MKQLRLKNISRKELLDLAVLKASAFKRESEYKISVQDIIEYLGEVKWKHKEVVYTHEVANDIFCLTENDILDYLSKKAIVDARTLNLDDFNDLLG